MANSLTGFRDRMEDDLETQVARLTKEVSRLKRSARRRGSSLYSGSLDGVSDLYAEIADGIVDSLPALRKRARRMNRAAHDNPAIVGLAGLALLGIAAAVFYRR
ncbi:MAG: hypothetical protein K5872_09230 [Rhizobiaceae bacterium]|nr:hypothetical protein [Rhizobiaceae bacterium]MCV0406397.1 hypothetical protein [Rhizobiaceae bacterium]